MILLHNVYEKNNLYFLVPPSKLTHFTTGLSYRF